MGILFSSSSLKAGECVGWALPTLHLFQGIPDKYRTGDKLGDHLEFALKYDGNKQGKKHYKNRK